jgi:nitrous oxidase accessory protein NosD
MRLKAVPFFVLVLLASGLFAANAGPASAVVACSVPSITFPTIQSAVNNPLCDPINVAAGTYNEQVQINRTLTLNGAQAGVDARTRSGPESIITNTCGPVQIMADNVKIDGFTIEGSTDPDPCFLSGIWTNPGFSGTHGGHTIVNNIVQNNISGIELDSDCTYPTLVQHNLIRNNNNPGPGSGNAIQTNFGLCDATIDSNTFSGHISSSLLVVAPSSGLHVTNNELVGGTREGIALVDVSSSSISGNTSIGSTSSGTIDLFGGNSNVAITNNVLANGTRGIQVEDPFGVGANSGVTAHANCISGNSVAGFEEDTGGYTPATAGSLDATNNWWGSPSGPTIASNPGGTGDKIIDQDGVVAYNPWLTSQPAAPCPVAFTKLASGSFVIGDQNAAVGSAVTFWGPQWSSTSTKWWSSNTVSGGSPRSFKGFADVTAANPPPCGQGWSTRPGNSSSPPASVPQYMAVIVSSSIGMSGTTITGNTVHVVVVKTNPGYAPDPGHRGTGTVVGVVC